VAVEGNEVELDRTVLVALSGGQESDHGTIAGLAVQGSALDGQRIRYSLPDDHGLAVGQNVVVETDWSRRYLRPPHPA
jgi:alanyl-tRNA synthetase